MNGSAPKVKETTAEKQAALEAQERWNERSTMGLLDLERADVAEADDDYTELFAGINSADVARAERTAYANVETPTATRLGDVNRAIGEADVMSKVDASQKAAAFKDSRAVASLNRGNDLAASSLRLGDISADLASNAAIERVQNQIMVDNSRNEAVMTALGGAAQGYAMKKAGYTRDKTGFTAPTTSDGKKGRHLGWTPLLQTFR